jgi:hypothetical protein
LKKLILALSFVFVLGLVSVNAQDKKKEVKKAPAKTEVAAPAAAATPAAKPAVKAKKVTKVAKVKKEAAPVKK